MRGIFNRQFLATLSCVLLILFAAVSINILGISALGNDGWESWLDKHKAHFFAWRVLLYTATGYGWWWMRSRVLLRERDAHSRLRLFRIELTGALALIVLETTTWLQAQ